MATREQLMTALRNADAAGDEQAARRIAGMIKSQGEAEQVAEPETGALTPVIDEGIPAAADLPQAQPAQPEGMGALDIASGVSNVILSGAAGAAKEAASGLWGIAGAPLGRGAESVEQAQSALPDYPMTEQGQQVISAIAEKYNQDPLFIKTIIDEVSGLGASLGESTFQATGSPLLATAAQMLPAALEAGTGMTGGRVAAEAAQSAAQQVPRIAVDVAGDVRQNVLDPASVKAIEAVEGLPSPSEVAGKAQAAVQKLSPTKREIAEAIETGSGDKIGAGFDVTPYGVVRENPAERAAMDQGWDDELIGAMKNATPTDRAAMKEMTDIRRRGSQNLLEKMENRPAKIAGESLMKRFKVVKAANRKAGQAVDRESRKLGGIDVDTFDLTNNFAESLQDRLKVTLTPDGKIDFRDSAIEKQAGARKALDDLVEIMGRGGKPDAERLHFMKKYIDEQVTFGKSQEGLAGETERILKTLRSDINNAIRDVSPDYAAANDAYSETIGALDNFQDVMGKKVDLTGSRADEAVGRNLRKLMSNYGVRENLFDSIAEIEQVAKKHGGEFDDNILLQAGYAQKLDDMFGAVADTSLRGAGTGAIRDAARGDLLGVVGNVATGAYKKFKGQTDKKAYDAMMDLLNQKPTNQN